MTRARKVELMGVLFTPREWEIAVLISHSYTTKQIAEEMGLTVAGLKTRLNHIYHRIHAARPETLNLDTRAVLATWVRDYLREHGQNS